jgi:hypothetical protein
MNMSELEPKELLKSVWGTFNKYIKTNQLVELRDIPSIKPVINDLFIERNIQLGVFEPLVA